MRVAVARSGGNGVETESVLPRISGKAVGNAAGSDVEAVINIVVALAHIVSQFNFFKLVSMHHSAQGVIGTTRMGEHNISQPVTYNAVGMIDSRAIGCCTITKMPVRGRIGVVCCHVEFYVVVLACRCPIGEHVVRNIIHFNVGVQVGYIGAYRIGIAFAEAQAVHMRHKTALAVT